jgi:hypothetical protein
MGPAGFVAKATATTFALLYLPFLAGFLILLARPSTGFQAGYDLCGSWSVAMTPLVT